MDGGKRRHRFDSKQHLLLESQQEMFLYSYFTAGLFWNIRDVLLLRMHCFYNSRLRLNKFVFVVVRRM